MQARGWVVVIGAVLLAALASAPGPASAAGDHSAIPAPTSWDDAMRLDDAGTASAALAVPDHIDRRSLRTATTSEGIWRTTGFADATGAIDWHRAGITGAGQWITIVDLGFDGYEALLGTELPASIGIRDHCDGHFDGSGPDGAFEPVGHGTAIAEIVHDMAPDANLVLACIDDVDDFTAWNGLNTRGSDVVVVALTERSAGNGAGGFDHAPYGQAIAAGRARGELWVVPAGNDGDSTLRVRPSDIDGDHATEFRPGPATTHGADPTELLTVTLDPGDWIVAEYSGDINSNSMLRFCAWVDVVDDDHWLGCAPWSTWLEDPGVFYENESTGRQRLLLMLHRSGSDFGEPAAIYIDGPRVSVSPLNTSSTVSFPGDLDDAITAGATCVNGGGVRTYSGVGPTLDGRIKPDLAGPDSVSTTVYGSRTTCGSAFTGTSSATAHIGGALALLGQQFPDASADELELELLSRTVGGEGPYAVRNDIGAGRLHLGPTGAMRSAETPAALAPLAQPVRVLDTRRATGGHQAPLVRDEVHVIEFPTNLVPLTSTAVVLNVTAVSRARTGHLTLAPAGEAMPTTSNINYRHPQTVANHATVAVSQRNGKMAVQLGNFFGETDVVVDLIGTYGSHGTALFEPLRSAVRAVDTRYGGAASGRRVFLGPDETFTVDLTTENLPIPDDATAVALNVTAVGGTGRAHLSVTPAGVPVEVSSLNYPGPDATPNLVVVGLDGEGRIDLTNAPRTRVHVVVDVVGYYAPTGRNGYVAKPPQRIADTRFGHGHTGRIQGEPDIVTVHGRGHVPGHVRAVLLNATITRPRGNGYATLFPGGEPQPSTSNLNYRSGQTVANSVITPVDGGVAIASLNPTDLVLDTQGWFEPVSYATPVSGGGDFLTPQADYGRSGHIVDDPVGLDGTLVERWRVPRTGSNQPLVIDGRVITVDAGSGDLTARRPSDGAVLWTRSLPDCCDPTLTSDGDRIYVATHASLAVFDATDGTPVWTVEPVRHRTDTAVLAGDSVIYSHRTYDARTGAHRLVIECCIDDILVDDASGSLLAPHHCLVRNLDVRTGHQRASRTFACTQSFHSAHATSNGQVVHTFGGVLGSRYLGTQATMPSSREVIAIADGVVYVEEADRPSFTAWHITTGTRRWEIDRSVAGDMTKPLVVGGHVVVAVGWRDQDPELWVINAATGAKSALPLPGQPQTGIGITVGTDVVIVATVDDFVAYGLA